MSMESVNDIEVNLFEGLRLSMLIMLASTPYMMSTKCLMEGLAKESLREHKILVKKQISTC